MISRLKSQVQDVLDSDAVLENMSEAEKQVTLAKAKLIKNLPAITASLKLLVEIMIWITVSFTAFWTMQKIALRREFNRQLGEFNFFLENRSLWVKNKALSAKCPKNSPPEASSITPDRPNDTILSLKTESPSLGRFMNYEMNYNVISYHEFN